MYVVCITRFTDDYKCRYGSWSELKPPRVFSTFEKAKQYLSNFLLKEIEERDIKSKLYDYYDDDGNVFDDTPSGIFAMCQGLFQGEFVPTTLEYKIEKCKIE